MNRIGNIDPKKRWTQVITGARVLARKGADLLRTRDAAKLAVSQNPQEARIGREIMAARQKLKIDPIGAADLVGQLLADFENLQVELTAAQARIKDLKAQVKPALADDVDAVLKEEPTVVDDDIQATRQIPIPTITTERLNAVTTELAGVKTHIQKLHDQFRQNLEQLRNMRAILWGPKYQVAQLKVIKGGKFFSDAEVSLDQAALVTNVGVSASHPTNEDTIIVAILADGREVFIVADGMGGHGDGDLASLAVADNFLFALECGLTIEQAVVFANYHAATTTTPNSGSTLVAAVLDRQHNFLQIAQVGDSRAKFINPLGAQHLTFDHGLILDLLVMYENQGRYPQLPLSENTLLAIENLWSQKKDEIAAWFTKQNPNAQFPAKNVITSGLGATNVRNQDVLPPEHTNIIEIELVPSQEPGRLTLCCDGMTSHTPEPGQTKIAQNFNLSELDVAKQMRDFALASSGKKRSSADNVSAVVVALGNLSPGNTRVTRYNRKDNPLPALPIPPSQTPPPQQVVVLPGPGKDPLTMAFEALTTEQRQLMEEHLITTRFDRDFIAAKPLAEQLILIYDRPLAPQVRQEVIDQLGRNHLKALLEIWNSKSSPAVDLMRSAAQLVLFNHLETILAKADENLVAAATLIKNNKLKPVLLHYIESHAASTDFLAGAAGRVRDTKTGFLL